MHPGWKVLVADGKIVAVGPDVAAAAGAETLALPGTTLLPGLIDLHVHLFLHPYNETSWNDQVMKEPLSLRPARAVAHARATLMAGFTTVRDLGTEGAGDADAGLKAAIQQGLVPGPRLLIANRALVATGAYGPKGYAYDVPQGAEEVSGDGVVAAVRRQIAHGADWVKFYADYRWGPGEPSRATFSLDELKAGVAAAHDAGRKVAVHASTPEGMRRAILAGADTIEHGNDGTAEVFALMKARGAAFCPTLAATDAITRYGGVERRSARAPGDPRQKAQLCRGAQGRRDPVCGRRYRRVPAWRQCARNRADGGLGAFAGRCAAGRDRGQCPDTRNGTEHRHDRARQGRGSGRGRGRSDRRYRRAPRRAAGDAAGEDRDRTGQIGAADPFPICLRIVIQMSFHCLERVLRI
jgi:hypothetical protein